MTRCVMLLDGPVRSDARVIRTARSLARRMRVALYHVDPTEGDRALFDDRVELHPVERPRRKAGLLRRCRELHLEFDFLADAALRDRSPCDLVWANDYPTLWPARRVAMARGAKLVYDTHEIYLETVNQFFPRDASLPRRLAFRVLTGIARRRGRRIERRLIRRADLVATVNESLAGWFRREYGVAEVAVVRNCVDPTAVPERTLPAGEGTTVLYQGVMNDGRGLEPLVRSARWFDPDLRLVLIGYGMLEEKLRRIAAEEGLGGRVEFRGRIEYEEMLAHTVEADLGVVLLEPLNLSKELALPNKVFEYMAAGVPVLASDLPELRGVVGGCDAGWLVSTLDPRGLAAEVNRIFEDTREMARRGGNGRKGAESCFAESSAALDGVIDGLSPDG